VGALNVGGHGGRPYRLPYIGAATGAAPTCSARQRMWFWAAKLRLSTAPAGEHIQRAIPFSGRVPWIRSIMTLFGRSLMR